MSAKSGKGRQGKAAKGSGEQSVLGSLPATRPARMSRRREGGDRAPAATATVQRPKAAKVPTAREKLAAAKPNRPEAVSAGSPRLRTTPSPSPSPPPREPERRSGPPTGVELATTVVQAAGEVAQIGATVGKQILKRTLSRIPRP